MSSTYPYKYKPIRNRIIPLSNEFSRNGWEMKGVAHQYGDQKLKDVVAEFGLRAPYDISSYVEMGEEDRKIINCNQNPQKPNIDVERKNIEYQVASREQIFKNTDFSRALQKEDHLSISNIGLYKKLIDMAFQLRSSFQCFTFKREVHTKREFSFEKSSIQNQDLSCEHLEQLKV